MVGQSSVSHFVHFQCNGPDSMFLKMRKEGLVFVCDLQVLHKLALIPRIVCNVFIVLFATRLLPNLKNAQVKTAHFVKKTKELF